MTNGYYNLLHSIKKNGILGIKGGKYDLKRLKTKLNTEGVTENPGCSVYTFGVYVFLYT
jgi:hypothetical protein